MNTQSELAVAVEKLFEHLSTLDYGEVGLNLTIHAGQVTKVEYRRVEKRQSSRENTSRR
jgi:hypothetical protein